MGVAPALAQSLPDSAPHSPAVAASPPAGLKGWLADIKADLQAEGGAMFNSARGTGGQNFGRLLSPYANQPMLNQLALTLTLPVEEIGGGYGIGANFQMIYGSDARIYLVDGVSDKWMGGQRYQLSPTVANLAVHLPWVTKYGVDGQFGIYNSPMGVETLDPAARAFYTLAYTTEYSTPFEHVGALFHVNFSPHWALLLDVDAGNQVSFGKGNGNGEPDGMIGLSGSDLFHKRLSVNYVLRMGPEDSWRELGSRQQAKSSDRFWNDLNATYQISRKWSATLEFNQLHDEGLHADAWGAVGWAAWQFHKNLAFNVRGEIYRDGTGQFVEHFPGSSAYARSILGLPNNAYGAAGTTYGDFTLNAVWKPEIPRVRLLQIRPEIRFDRALNGTRPFDAFRHQNRILVGGDITLGI